jgi:hypothetical protein
MAFFQHTRRTFFIFFLSLAAISSANAAQVRSPVINSLKRYGLSAYCIKSKRNYLATKRNGRFAALIISPRSRLLKNRAFSRAFQSSKVLCSQGRLFRTGRSAPTDGGGLGPVPPAIPELARWQNQMLSNGRSNCSQVHDLNRSFDSYLIDTYYDGELVFYQIGDYTKDSSWYECAQASEHIYRDLYVFPNNGLVPGYWDFSAGMARNYLSTGDSESRRAAILLSTNATYTRDDTPVGETQSAAMAREVAYAIMTHLNAEKVGAARRPRLYFLVDAALRYIDDWTIRHNAPYTKPFMIALLSQALIQYQEVSKDARVLPALERLWDYVWDTMWVPGSRAFRYLSYDDGEPGATSPAPDLNLLIAPAFAWIFHQTGDMKYLTRGDQIFAGGVTQAYLAQGKQFNQNYRWSFDYVKWRSQRPLH